MVLQATPPFPWVDHTLALSVAASMLCKWSALFSQAPWGCEAFDSFINKSREIEPENNTVDTFNNIYLMSKRARSFVTLSTLPVSKYYGVHWVVFDISLL